MNRAKLHIWLLWMAFLSGLLITGIGIWRIIDASAMFAPGEVVEARVVEVIQPPASEDGERRPIPVLEWTDTEGGIRRLTSIDFEGHLPEGSSVEVVYQPLDPSATRIRSLRAIPFTSYLPVLSGIILCLLAAVRLRR